MIRFDKTNHSYPLLSARPPARNHHRQRVGEDPEGLVPAGVHGRAPGGVQAAGGLHRRADQADGAVVDQDVGGVRAAAVREADPGLL